MEKVIQLEALKIGEQLPPLKKPAITKVQLVQYAGASGDFNPLHIDDAFAQKIGMDGVIAHGMLIMGFLGEYVQNLAGEAAESEQFSMRFGGMTVAGDDISCHATVENREKKSEKPYASREQAAEKEAGEGVGTGKAVLYL